MIFRLLLITNTNRNESDKKSLRGILGQEKTEVAGRVAGEGFLLRGMDVHVHGGGLQLGAGEKSAGESKHVEAGVCHQSNAIIRTEQAVP